jgi:hypothetical protein
LEVGGDGGAAVLGKSGVLLLLHVIRVIVRLRVRSLRGRY